jgi:ferredoxin-NADP reductase
VDGSAVGLMAAVRQVTVSNRLPLARGVLGLELVPADGMALPPWEAGAHIDLVLSDGMVRQYSLCGDPANQDAYLIAVLLVADGRGGSAYLHERVSVGDTLGFIGPRNRFPLVARGPYLFIAGGIGITPIIPMIQKARSERVPWHLIYGGRSRSSMAFVRELERFERHVTIVAQDEDGYPDVARAVGGAAADAAVYCCGPDGLLEATARAVSTLGRPVESLHVESFVNTPARVEPRETGGPDDRAFDIVLASSGTTLRVPPGVSILETVQSAGLAPLSSCREGTCGTCETTVLDGVPDHRDSLLTESERAANDIMFICVSRARSERLVLDL